MHNPTRQMEKQPNQLLWHGIFLLLVLAALLFAAGLLPWLVRNALIYCRPRRDGRPG